MTLSPFTFFIWSEHGRLQREQAEQTSPGRVPGPWQIGSVVERAIAILPESQRTAMGVELARLLVEGWWRESPSLIVVTALHL